jgi:PAS domain S-box-containing protein
VFTVDKEFRITFLNRAAEKMLGVKREEAIGRFCKHVLKSQYCLDQCPIARVLESGENLYDHPSSIAGENGMMLPIRLNAAILRNAEDEAVGGVVSFRDLSLDAEVREYLKHEGAFHGMIGRSKAMTEIFNLILDIKDSDAPVLIQGETGTGKELVANAIQASSRRSHGRFVKVNCSSLPPQLLGSELFGHSRGAFTDAVKDRVGRFEFADRGTILLDEIGDMPLPMQTQLLRVLQEGTFERLGESATRKVDVRVIAATNGDIHSAMASGTFRNDLFYRLNVVPIKVPPLRERVEDIPFLVKHFIEKYELLYEKTMRDIHDSTMDLLLQWHWPGNVRELENVIEYALVRVKPDAAFCVCLLPPALREGKRCPEVKGKKSSEEGGDTTSLTHLLERHHWNQSRVAQVLGVNRTTIWRRMKNLGIDKVRPRC